jgi:murein DD-endopeptidase MepM/ murein hydrolase activator NlpD
VKPGASVKRGDVIGFVGATGRATGAHVHYEILANGQLINPLQLLTQPAH